MKKPIFLLPLVLGMALLFFSCASQDDAYKEIDAAVEKDDFQGALAEIERERLDRGVIYKKGNEISEDLDKGLITHYAGDYESSYTDLLDADRRMQTAYTTSITQDVMSYIANDKAKDYAGEDYEDIYANIFNALNAYHLNNGQAYALINSLVAQGGELQYLGMKYAEDESKAKQFLAKTLQVTGTIFSLGTVPFPESKSITFSNSALARYLGALFAQNDGNIDMARFQIYELQNAFSTPVYSGKSIPQSLLVTGPRGSEAGPFLDIPPGKGQLNVLAFAGLSPIKREEVQNVAFPFLSIISPIPLSELVSPIFAIGSLVDGKLKVPILVSRPSAVQSISVEVEGVGTVGMDLLEDMGDVVRDTFNGHLSSIYLKTYTRVVAKYITVGVAAKIGMDQSIQQGTSELAARLIAVGLIRAAKIGLDATEGADTRQGRYLPDKAYINRGTINLAPGTYQVTVNYTLTNGKVMAVTKTVQIKAGAHTLVEAVCLK